MPETIAENENSPRSRFSISDRVKEQFTGTLAAGMYLATGTVTAQSGVSEAMCGTGIGQLLSLALGAVSVFLVVKGGFRTLMGFDKKGSSKSQKQMEGNAQVKGGAQTMAVGAIGPAVIAGILDVAGVSTLSCFEFAVATIAATPL
jgi:hypothetical protein